MKLLRESPDNFSYLRRQEIYLTKLGTAEIKLGDRPLALQHLRQAQEVLATLTARDPADAQVMGDQHSNWLALAEVYLLVGDPETALKYYRQTLTLAQKSVAASRKDLYAQRRLAEAYAGLGRWYAVSRFKLSGAERTVRQQQACEWRRKELAVWDEWTRFGAPSAFNHARREQAARAVVDCETTLARLSATAH